MKKTIYGDDSNIESSLTLYLLWIIKESISFHCFTKVNILLYKALINCSCILALMVCPT